MTELELKKSFTDKVSVNYTRELTTKVFDLLLEQLETAIVEGTRIEVRGFGAFSLRTYKPYLGRNPKTSAAVEVKGKLRPVFKPGKSLKELVAQSASQYKIQ